MNKEAITNEIREVVSVVSGIPADDIALDAHFVSDLQISSFDTIMIIGEVEERYDINVPRDVLYKLDTIQKVVDYLSEVIK